MFRSVDIRFFIFKPFNRSESWDMRINIITRGRAFSIVNNLIMELGQIINMLMANVFRKCFTRFEGLGPKSRPFLVYQTTSINQNQIMMSFNSAGIYLFKVNNRNTRTRCEICSKLTINTPERRQWRRSGVFIDNFEHISHLVLVFLLLTLSR